MVHFLIFVLASIGLAHILVDGIIMNWIKDWLKESSSWLAGWTLKMLGCYQCAGFWSGVIIAIMMTTAHHFKLLHWLDFIVYGFAASFLANLGAVVIQYINLQALRGVTTKDEK